MKIITMYLIFLLIVLNKFVKADDDSDSESSKYIDLLPEKEKEEFLQRIERRILADVKTRDDRDRYDGEVSEDELNTHHEFVQKIVKEESDNFRRIDGRENDKDAIIDNNENPEDDMKVKSLETNKESLNRGYDNKYIDLTLRHGKRDKRNDKSKEIIVEVRMDKPPDKQHTVEVNSKEHVDINNEDHEEVKEVNVEESSTIGFVEPNKLEESDSEDIRIKPSRRSEREKGNDTMLSQIVTSDASEPNITQTHNSDATLLDNNNDEYSISQTDSQLNDIVTTPRPEDESITVSMITEETTPQEITDELITVYYNTDEKHNISNNSFENLAKSENNSRKNLNNIVTDEVKSFTDATTSPDITSDDNVVEEVTNESTIETTPSPEEETITVAKVIEDTTPQEINDEITTAFYYKSEEKYNLSSSQRDNNFENITTTENNSRKNFNNNVTDEVKGFIDGATSADITSEHNVVEEVTNESTIETTPSPEEELITVAKVIEDTTPQEINELLTTEVYYKSDEKYNLSSSQRDNNFENITTTENNSRKNLNNNVTDEVKSDIKNATTNTSHNIVEEITNESTIADLKQDNTKNVIEITTKDNIEIQNVAILRNNESPISATANSNIVADLDESVEITDTVTESNINYISSIETMNNNVDILGNFNNDSDKLVATTVKDQNDTKIYLQQSSHIHHQDTEKAKGNVSSIINVDALKIEYNKKSKLKEYNVFEVPRGEPPFIQKAAPTTESSLHNQEQPYYVPVHNYEPNNAYFNAHNRLGPNYDSDKPPYNDRVDETPKDVNEKSGTNFEADYFFDSKEKALRQFRFRVSTKKPYSSRKPLTYFGPIVVRKPKYTDIYFNPDDYLDVDYYFSKMKRGQNKNLTPFPSSSDEDHPYQSIAGQDLKDHIRAIRNILWRQNHFGFIPPSISGKDKNKEKPDVSTTTVKYTFRSKNGKDNQKNSKLDTNKNIALDYYFGRMQNEDVKKIGYIIKNNIHKDVFLKTEEIPSDNIVADIKVIKFNDKQYVNDDVKSVTPHAFLLTDLSEENEKVIIQKPMKRYSHSTIDSATQKPEPEHGEESSIDTIAKIAKIADMKDIFLHIQSMLSMKMPITRKNNDDIDVYVKVLDDMIKKDDLALKRYDWLETTVDIRAALAKLIEMTESWQERAILDPADIELLNYTLFLHKSSKELAIKKESEKMNFLRKPLLLPRNKKKKKRLLLHEKGLLQRVWLLRRKKYNEISNLKGLLNDLQYYLYDLHEAIKNIALVTKFKNQHWYESLKKIYLTSNKRTMLEVILHLTTTRLLGLIEESAQNGLEDDFIDYILHHEKEVNRTVEEFMFVLKLIEELKRFDI